MKTPNTFKVLHLDDDETQLEFAKIFLEKDKEIKIKSISSPLEALELLRRGDYDCIISDYKMPEMDGIKFAKKVRKKRNTPIIIYTGQGSEEVAEAAFAAGIDDYVRKENNPKHYKVLAKRVISVIERRRSEESSRYLFENASDAIYIHDIDGNLLDVNKVACNRLGFSKNELLNIGLMNLVSPASRASFTEHVSSIFREGHRIFESSTVTRSGQVIPVEVSAKVIKFRGVEAILSFSRDVSERKRIEDRMMWKLEALNRHAVDLVNMNSVEDVAEYSFEVIHELLGFALGCIGIVKGDVLSFIYARNVYPNLIPDLPLNGRGVTVRAVKTGKTQSIPDTRLDPDFVRDIELPDLLSELDVPVKVGGKVVAVINLEKEGVGAFSDEDKRIVEILSEHVASAISRIEQIRVIKASGEEYQRLLDTSLDAVVLLSGM